MTTEELHRKIRHERSGGIVMIVIACLVICAEIAFGGSASSNSLAAVFLGALGLRIFTMAGILRELAERVGTADSSRDGAAY